MTTIITGNFQQQDVAERALSALASAGFPDDQVTTFFVNPPGQHDLYRLGGDENESAGTEHAGGGAAAGAAVGGALGVAAGLATLPVLGPGAAVAAAGVGAYAGALYGALANTENANNPTNPAEREELRHSDAPRKSGVLVAVAVTASIQQETAIRILRDHGAADSECTEGTIVAGEWIDFDPLTPLRLLATPGAARSHVA